MCNVFRTSFPVGGKILIRMASTRKRQPISRLLNKKKDQKQSVSIYSGMTIDQVAEVMNRSRKHVYECISTIGKFGNIKPDQGIIIIAN